MSVTPVSWAMICCVRSACSAASDEGSAQASSLLLVCSDWHPPSTAASACSDTRTTLLSGCCAVSDWPDVCAWKRSLCERLSVAPKVSRISWAQMRLAARNLPISSKKLLCTLKKKLSLGANSSTLNPRSCACRTYSNPSASVNASSCTALDPASRMWYPLILMGFQRGTCLAANSTVSVTSRIDGLGGKMYSFWAMYSFRISFWMVPPILSSEDPCFSAKARYIAQMIAAGALMVIEVVTWSSLMPSNSVSMSASDDTATPQVPNSPNALGSSVSYPYSVGMSNATDRPVCPCSSRNLNRSFVSCGRPKPANIRNVQSRPRYPVSWMPRR